MHDSFSKLHILLEKVARSAQSEQGPIRELTGRYQGIYFLIRDLLQDGLGLMRLLMMGSSSGWNWNQIKPEMGPLALITPSRPVPHARANRSLTLVRSCVASTAATSGGTQDARSFCRPGRMFLRVD